MKFYPLTDAASADLTAEYDAAREIGVVRLGTEHLFFRSKRKHYYIPYQHITRFYRRVLMVPAKLCCGQGSFDVEHLVLEREDRELAQIQLPGTRAAKVLMEELQRPSSASSLSQPGTSPPRRLRPDFPLGAAAAPISFPRSRYGTGNAGSA